MATEIEKRLLTVDECIKMVERHILAEDERVELIHGELVRMSPIGPLYSALRRGQTAAPELLPECVIRVDDLLP